MARMKVLRLPTEAELDNTIVEAHTFLDVFNKKSVSGFIAEVERIDDDCVDLDGWIIEKADWFIVED